MKVPRFIPSITRSDIRKVVNVLGSGRLTSGPVTEEFEKSFAAYIGVSYAVSVSSGSAALHLCIRAMDIGDGDEVLMPVLNFPGAPLPVKYCGARPVFVDVDERTLNIDSEKVKEAVGPRTKAILVMHYGGQPCDMKEIMQIANDFALDVIEDCSHAVGAEYAGQKVGRIGIAGCFSFYPTKPMTTCEGGMVTTNDESLAKRVRILRQYGLVQKERSQPWVRDIMELGYSYRMSEVESALGLSQLRRLDRMNTARIRRAHILTRLLKDVSGLATPHEAPYRTHVYHLYAVQVLETFGVHRDIVHEELSRRGVESGVHYIPLHMLTLYRNELRARIGAYPSAERIYDRVLTLPMYSSMKLKEIEYVAEQLKSIRS